MSLVTKDVPAFMTVAGNPAWAVGLNVEGIKRRNIETPARAALKQAHRLVYRSGLKVDAALGEIAELRSQFSEVETFAASIEASDVGIIRGSERGRAK
jgi:UDP-N-acetylglucosamine acyltransferase